MRRIDHITGIVAAMLLSAASLSSCSDNGGEAQQSDYICVNTLALNSGRVPKVDVEDNTFMVLFWLNKEHLETNFDNAEAWTLPYLAGHAPQPVAFYEHSVYDLRYPYPRPETVYLYATGYAPGSVLAPADGADYRTLTTTSELTDANRGRYDFLGCDVWSDVYRGSRADPFSQDKNRLYFRHLAAKLLVFADRDKETMENRQFVRDVRVTNLKMSLDGGTTWTSMFTPAGFEWQRLAEGDFTASYTETINTVKTIRENLGVVSVPQAGYKTVASEAFAGDDPGFRLQTNAADRVPIYGMVIDSCYVCNPFEAGAVQIDQPIRLKMDISAEMSYDPNFPLEDEPSGTPGDGSGSTTDNLTFTRTWTDVTVDVKAVENGLETANPVYEFKPGYEYRIYIHFHRSGVDLVARELPWYDGGSHYIPIPGGDPQPGGTGGGTGETGGETGGGTGETGGETGETGGGTGGGTGGTGETGGETGGTGGETGGGTVAQAVARQFGGRNK